MNKAWYKNISEDEDAERFRVVKTAAEIILQDIGSQVYDTSYPACTQFLNNVDAQIPTSLKTLLEGTY